jgi:LmbE family N-acetylglucosaminyl deacetylase
MNVLVIAPHPDDEILGVGGTMRKFVTEGNDVYVCIVTKGHSTMYDDARINLVKNEALLAHKVIGVKKTYFLDLPAVFLDVEPKNRINMEISKVILETKPDIVFIPHFGDMHLDHGVVSRASMVALRPLNHKVTEIYSYETLSETEWNLPHSSNSFIPNTYINVSHFIDYKIEAMKCFKSQLYEFPHPRSIDAIRFLAKTRGSTILVDCAEAFCLIRRIFI